MRTTIKHIETLKALARSTGTAKFTDVEGNGVAYFALTLQDRDAINEAVAELERLAPFAHLVPVNPLPGSVTISFTC